MEASVAEKKVTVRILIDADGEPPREIGHSDTVRSDAIGAFVQGTLSEAQIKIAKGEIPWWSKKPRGPWSQPRVSA